MSTTTSDDIPRIVESAAETALTLAPGTVTAGMLLRDDLGAEDLDLLEIALIVEERIGTALPDSVIRSLGSSATACVGDLSDAVRTAAGLR